MQSVPRHPDEVTGNLIVLSGSELIGDGLVGLLPRGWRGRITIAPVAIESIAAGSDALRIAAHWRIVSRRRRRVGRAIA